MPDEKFTKEELAYGKKELERWVPSEEPIDPEVTRYGEGLKEFLNSMVASGDIDPAQAQQVWVTASAQVSERGITLDLPYYIPVSKGQTYQDVMGEYRAGIPTPSVDKWAEFNTEWDRVLASDITADQKQGELLNLVNRLGTEVDLDPTALENLQWKAINDAFRTLPPEEQERRRAVIPGAEAAYQRSLEAQRQRELYREPRYAQAFEEMRATIPKRWQRWFAGKYVTELSQYKATLGKDVTAEEAEKGWAEHLEMRRPQLREEWWGRTPWERGERPSVYQPGIRTVQW